MKRRGMLVGRHCNLLAAQFHVDKLSSAHIYLRLREGETWDNIPEDLLTDLAQLTKANSIEGSPGSQGQMWRATLTGSRQ